MEGYEGPIAAQCLCGPIACSTLSTLYPRTRKSPIFHSMSFSPGGLRLHDVARMNMGGLSGITCPDTIHSRYSTKLIFITASSCGLY